MALAEIATQVGFQTQSHFTSVFRRLVGTTPKHYRMLHQTNLQAVVAIEQQEKQPTDEQKSATAA